jgi:outer membrane receptor protein involved in Fe transport
VIAALMLFLATTLTGVVHDSSGGVVSGAAVIVRATGSEQRTTTGPDGRFSVDVTATGDVIVTVLAGGFAESKTTVSDLSRAMEITLAPAGLMETVTVTPTRSEQRTGDVAASVNILDSQQIRESPAVVADDVLRQIPTFSLFRRSSSLSTHPTSQGVSLRGIGPSGVSRTLVLSDGVPVNDPFGGWVYWTRVPLETVDRIEVVDNSSSSIYGNYALGGVINIVSEHAERRSIDIKPQYGNNNSPKIDVSGSDVYGKVGIRADVSAYNTDGFPVVATTERGVIDNNATVKFKNFNAKVDYDASDNLHTFFRTGYFSENRGNGKIDEINDTQWTSLNGGVRAQLRDGSALQATVFGDIENFHSTFMAVPATTPPRNTVRLSVDQHVPTNAVGAMGQWSKAIGGSNFFTAGGDFHWVEGDSQEANYNATGPVLSPVQAAVLALNRVSGGTQRLAGAFAQDLFTPLSNLTITLALRLDHWTNYNPHNLETAVIPGTVVNNLPSCSQTGGVPPTCLQDRTDTAVSPRVAARYQLTNAVSVWGDVGGGFRAPTLNELYRQFRVGTTLTTANAQLGPETMKNGDVGVTIAAARNVTIRATWFDNQITDPVANVTLTVVGANITQQRQNLGATQIYGLQTDVEYRAGPYVRFNGAYLYDHGTVTDGGVANAGLVGKYIPQVPLNRGSVRATYSNPKYLTAAFAIQFYGLQYDNDQNTTGIPAQTLSDAGYVGASTAGLPAYTEADLSLARSITKNIEAFFGMENMFNKTYFVGTGPSTIGSPRLVNGGVRIRFSGK